MLMHRYYFETQSYLHGLIHRELKISADLEKNGEKSVQLVKGASFRSDLL